MVQIVEHEYRITQADPNVTVYDVSKDVEGKCLEYICPDKTIVVFRADDVLSFYAKDNGTTPTEIPETNQYKLRITDPNEIVRSDKATVTYRVIKEFVDRMKIYKLGIRFKLTPKQKLQLITTPSALSTGATKLDKTTIQFQISCRRIAELIPI